MKGPQVNTNGDPIKVHELKTLPHYFSALVTGAKTFEVRNNDRGFKVGDVLKLREWSEDGYSSRVIYRSVEYIMLGGVFGLAPGWCVMALGDLSPDQFDLIFGGAS